LVVSGEELSERHTFRAIMAATRFLSPEQTKSDHCGFS
jgi:hypothetical protein